MSRKWLTLWCVLLGTFVAGTLFAQDQPDPRKWSIDPRMTAIKGTGEVPAVPQGALNYVNPNTTARVIHTPNEILTINPAIRVHPSTTVWQSEVPITRHPTNGNILYASSNAVTLSPSLFISEGMYLTTNGGTTWFGNDTTMAAPISGHSGDPAPAIGPDGRLYMSEITSSGMGVEYSTNMGATWSSIIGLATGSQDKNHTFVNDVPSSPYYGRAYVTWSLFTVGTPPAVVSYTTNLGATWTAPITVLAPGAGHYQQGVNGTVGANGDAYICWQSPMAGSPFTGLGVGFAKSTDGGATWAGQDIAYACNGIRGTLSQKAGIRVNDFPSMAVDRSGGGRNGWIYIVTAEQNLAPAGSDPDIIMHRSTNGGATWSAGIRVNQDALNNGKIQYMPWMVVDNAGGLNVVYYDDRNTTSDSATVFVSRSLDGGNTWTDFEVSDRHFRPAPIPGLAGGYQGDYIGITAANGKIYPYWCDNRTGIYQAFVTSVTTTENFGWVKGIVTNVSGGAALQGASIDFTDPIPQVGALTDINGFYKAGAKVDTPATSRNVTLRARKFGFRDTLLAVTIPLNDTTTRNFAMTPVPNGTLVVRTVRTDSSNIRSGVNVLFNGISVASGNTDSLTGIFSTVLPLGSYDVLIDPPSPYGSRRFNSFVVTTGSNPLYVVVRKVVENSPLAMRDTLAVGQVHAKTLTLTNTTTDSIPYRLSDDNALAKLKFSRPAVQPRKVEIPSIQPPKGSPERRGPAQTDSSGGPDAFGYRWIDSDSPGGPVFNWFNIDTAGRGTQISFPSLDDGTTPVPLGIPFPFYGNNYSTTLNVCTNGWMSFTSTTNEYFNGSIPDAATPNNAIYPFWDDLNLTSGGNVKYYYDAANTRFIVQYTNVPPYSGTGTGTWQVILYPNGQIIMQYLSMTYGTPTATIGIENADGTVASQVSYNGPYVHNNLAIKFYLPDASWLSEAPSFGTIPAGSNANITVTFDATNLTLGTTYNANIIMDLTHPDVTGSQLIPASLRVISGIGPVISVSPTTVTFPLTIIGNNRRDSVRVRNVGSGTPNVILSSVTTTNPRYVATATSTSIAPGDSARIRIVYTPIVPGGTDTGRVVILSNDPANPRVDVQLTGSSVGSILLATSIDSLVKPNMQGGTMDSTRFFVRNVGTAGGNIQARAIMIPRTSPDGPATGPAVVVPMKVSSSQTPINYPNDHITPSVGFAPVGGSPARPEESPVAKGSEGISKVLTANGYGNDYRSFQWTVFDPLVPGTLTGLGPITSADAIYAGDFTMDGTGFIAIKGATNQLISINPANGSYTVIGPVTIDGGHTWTSAKFDPTSGTFYATSTNITVSSLYTIDVTTGTTTRVATITNMPAIIGMAIQPGTGQMYGYDIVGDNFYSIDKVTGTGTLIGPIGFNANLAQDMAFDRQTGVLYMAAYNGSLSIGEARSVNLATGATTLIGQIGTGDHLIDPFSIQGSWGPSSNWLSIAPTTGSIALNDSLRFTATFDATSPAIYTLPGNYFGHVEINTVGAPAPDTLKIPARMFVVPSPGADLVVEPDSVSIGNVEIGRTDSSKSMLVRNIGASTLTVTNVTFTGSSGFSAGRTSFTLASLDTLRVKVKFTASAPGGVRNAVLHFTSNDPTPDTLKLHAVSVGVAHFTVRPDTFHFSLPIGPDTTRTNFRIVSTGTDTLHYQISESSSRAAVDESAAIERSKVQHPANNLGKGAIDPTPGERDSSGGPDAFGYRWIDSDTPGGPAFNWVDISSVGTAVSFTNLDDGNSTIPFPFSFPFYGTTFSGNINVCTNGWLSFTDGQTLYSNTAIPSASAPLNGIFPFWDDLYLVTSGTVYYYNDAANNRFIVEYLNVPHFSSGGPYTFEIIFKPDGTILYQYLSMDAASSNSATVGVQDAAGAVALQVAFNSTYIHNNLAVLITSDLIPWMSTDRTFGTVAPGDSTTVSLRIHPAPPLQGGDYLGYQRVTGNTPDVHPVGVTLTATGGQNRVTVTAPNGGEQWARNTSHQITWTKTGNVDSVRIEFSTNGGTAWTLITAGTPARLGLQRHPKFSAVPEVGGEVDNPNGVYNWLIPAGTTPSTNCFVKVSWTDSLSVNDISNSAFTILAAPPADTSWATQTSGTTTAFYSVKAVDNNVAWAGGGTGAGTTGFVRRTIDGGTTWTAAGTFPADVFCITAIDANTAIAGNWTSAYTRLVKTTNGGVSWRTVDSVGAGGFYDNVRMFDANNGIAQGDPVGGSWVIKKTSDGGNTWVPISPALPQVGTEAGWNNSMDFLGANGWFGTNNTRIYRTTDFGSTWTSAATTFLNSYSVAFAALNAGLAGSDTGPFNKSVDAGATWTAGPAALTAADLSIWANPGSSGATGQFWATSGLNVWYSSNFGTSWSSAPNQGYTGTQQANHVNMVNIGGSIYGWMVGNGGVVARFRRIAVNVEVVGNEIPTVFALSQNYPNPFNPTTNIKYDLPEQATVTLKIYNILGQEVMTLANGAQAAGRYEATWEGRNNFGAQVSSGVYFYRFEATGASGQTFSTLKKMLFLK